MKLSSMYWTERRTGPISSTGANAPKLIKDWTTRSPSLEAMPNSVSISPSRTLDLMRPIMPKS